MIRYHRRMSRIALRSALAAALAVGAVSCSKSAGKEAPQVNNTGGGPEMVAVPGAGGPDKVAVPGAPDMGPPAGGTAGGAGGAPAGADSAFKLKPDEGELSIEVPPDAVAGKETTARVVVTPSAKYKINFEFPTKLSLKPPADVQLAKAELTAGGQGNAQGDAEKFEEKKLAFAVKLTPTKSGTHTVNGTFKFAVCDKDACLAKREVIAIQVAAK
jgi:hypothetical protein